jgi:hypothetical protein
MALILALDPSTEFGWALHRLVDEKPVVDCGTWELKTADEKRTKRSARPGQYFARTLKAVTELRRRFEIYDDEIQIVIENKSLNAIGNAETKHLAESWVGQFETYAEVRGWPAPLAVGVNSWRSAFIGRSMAPKEITDYRDRQKWIKESTIRECKRRGLNPEDANAADACGILFWFLVGGPVVQEQRRADRKAKTKAKRSQMRLFGKVAA